MKPFYLVGILCSCLQAQSFAQHIKQEGLLVYTLGNDTTMIGSYRLSGQRFELRVLSLEYAVVYEQTGSLTPRGEIESLEGISYQVAYKQPNTNQRSYRIEVRNDSTYTTRSTGEDVQRFAYAGRGVINNLVGHSTFFLPALWPHFSPAVGDSLVSRHMWWSSPLTYTIRRTSKHTMRVGSTLMGFLTLHLGNDGSLDSVNALGSSLNLIGHVHSYRPMDSVIDAYVLREHTVGKVGTNNKADSVVATVGAASITIHYNRPSMRGRQIFGSVVPYGRFWRTGANQATTISITKPISVAGKELAAGEYSLFTLPGEESWELMFNSQTEIWGTQYDPQYDVLRVKMNVEALAAPVEMMTIKIVPHGGGAQLLIEWEKKRAWVNFDVVQ